MAATGSDFLGRCVPNACVVRGFERIYFAVLQLDQPLDGLDTEAARPHSEKHDRSSNARLRDVRLHLVKAQIIVNHLSDAPELWLFAPSPATLMTSLPIKDGKLDASPLLSGFRLTEKGSVDIAELLSHADASSSGSGGSSAQATKPGNVGPNASTQHQLKTEEKANKIYQTFMNAWNWSLSYHLCKELELLPTSPCSRLESFKLTGIVHEAGARPSTALSRDIEVSTTLTKHGSVIISWRSTETDGRPAFADKADLGATYQALPFGFGISLASPDAPPLFRGSAVSTWREVLCQYLEQDGIQSAITEWTSVHLAGLQTLCFDWPKHLCVKRDASATRDSDWTLFPETSQVDKPIPKDPIEFALLILTTCKEDDEPASPRDDARMEDDNSFTANLTPCLGGTAFSPPIVRYHDLTTASSLVYPTPPDVLSTGSAYADPSIDALSGLNGESTAASNNDVRDDPQTAGTPDGDEQMRDAPIDLNTVDDLFGDEPDGLPDNHHITDADFDIFAGGASAEAQVRLLSLSADRSTLDSIMTDEHLSGAVNEAGKEPDDCSTSIEKTRKRVETSSLAMHIETLDLEKPPHVSNHISTNLSPILEQDHTIASPDENRRFNPVAFNRQMSSSDSKYATGGRFFGSMPSIHRRPSGKKEVQPVISAKLTQNWSGNQKPLPFSQVHTLPRRRRIGARSATSSSNASDSSESDDVSADSSDSIDEEAFDDHGSRESGTDEPEPSASVKSSQMLRTEAQIQQIGTERVAEGLIQVLASLLPKVKSRQSIIAKETRSPIENVEPEGVTKMAQILLDNIVSTSIDNSSNEILSPNSEFELMRSNSLRRSILSVVTRRFPQSHPIEDVDAFAVVEPTPILSSPRLQGLGSSRPQSGQLETIVDLPAPSIEVSRNRSRWSLSAIGAVFWDTLGLAPVNGDKDAIAHCLVPGEHAFHLAARDFLSCIQTAYHSGRFGRHMCGHSSTGSPDGVVDVGVGLSSSRAQLLSAIEQSCRLLGAKLGRATSNANEASVVYLTDPFSDDLASEGALACALCLRTSFDEACTAEKNCLIIKILPLSNIARPFELSVLSPRTAFLLAQEIYDRIGGPGTNGNTQPLALPTFIAPSIELEEAAITRIPLQLTENSSSNPLLEGSCIHVAYARSSDEKWVTAIWTDTCGKSLAKAAYPMRGHTFPEIAMEMWATTIEIIRHGKFRWRLILAAVDGIRKHEMTAWLRFADRSKQWLNLTFVTVSSSPPVTVSAPSLSSDTAASSALGVHGPTSFTPTSTPNPAQNPTFSPAHTPPAGACVSTPISEVNMVGFGTDADPSARLIDVVDQSWALVLSHHINVCTGQPIFIPSIATGYLAKRTGPGEQDAPALLEVKLVYCGEQIAPGESAMARDDRALREVLSMFRGLALLGRLRGIIDERSTTPFHVVAAKRGADALLGFAQSF